MGADRHLNQSTLTRVVVVTSALALAAGATLASTAPARTPQTLGWLILGALALIAELSPVSIFRRGVRVTFTLPYLVGIAALCGPTEALLADVGASCLAAIAMHVAKGRRVAGVWVMLNVAIAALSSTAGGLAWYGWNHVPLSSTWSIVVPVLAFVVAYSVVNFAAVTIVDRTIHRSDSPENLIQSLKPGVQAVGTYFLVAVLVALLVRLDLTPYAVLTILPIAALRYMLQQKAKLYEHYYDTISTLALMLQRVHPYTLGHLRRVSAIAEEVALELGLSQRQARLVREAAVLHDIGKIAINEEILEKPARLTDAEFEHVKKHAAFGAQILSPVEAFQPMVKWIRHHHERPDGSGYPDQLSDIEIPIESKIIAVVDAYDAMTGGESQDKRTYRDPMTSAEAIAELERCSGTQFDSRVVSTFKAVVTGARS